MSARGLPPRALGGGARVRVSVGGRAPPPLLTGTRRGRHGRQRRVARAARQRHYHLSAASVIPMLAEPNPLPCAQVQLSIRDGDCQ